MKTSKISRLLALSEREYSSNCTAPVPKSFKALPVNLASLGTEWERRRGAAVRLMGVVLRQSSEGLLQKMLTDRAAAKAFGEAINWLQDEALVLRKTADRLDTSVARLHSVIRRYQEREQSLAPSGDTAARS